MKSFNLLFTATAVVIAIALPAKAFGQTNTTTTTSTTSTSTTISHPFENPHAITFDNLPSTENRGSVGLQATWLVLHSLYAEYEWASGKEWAFGGKVSAGIPLFQTLSNPKENTTFVGQVELRSRWYYNRLSRVRNGYTLRKNSGFFFEQGIGLLMSSTAILPSNNQNGFHPLGYGQLSLGYHYVARNNFSFSSQFGLVVGPMNSAFLLPLLDIKIGYAF